MCENFKSNIHLLSIQLNVDDAGIEALDVLICAREQWREKKLHKRKNNFACVRFYIPIRHKIEGTFTYWRRDFRVNCVEKVAVIRTWNLKLLWGFLGEICLYYSVWTRIQAVISLPFVSHMGRNVGRSSPMHCVSILHM